MSFYDYQLSYEINPIILEGGIAGAGPQALSTILSAVNFTDGLLNPSQGAFFFGNFRVLPGHNLMKNEIAMYPVANQSVAGNAVITDPLSVQLEMLVPANADVPVETKKSIMTLLKSILDQHTALGGWYNIATPSYTYLACLLNDLTDSSDQGDGSQVQTRWVWSFTQPLITIERAQAAQNQLMRKISNRTANAGDPPGSRPLVTSIGDPSANITQNVIPSSSNLQASNVTSGSQPSGAPSVQTVSPVQPGT